MTRAHAGDGPVARGRRIATALAVLAAAACAAGQQCTQEVEPNDTPALATVLSGDGPDAVAAAVDGALGALCLVGEREGSDQDAFLWVVDDAASAHEWTIELEGPRGGLTQVDVFEVELAENGVDVTRAENLFRFGTVDGRSVSSEPFLLGPGRYVVGVSGAQASGQYVAHLRPTPLTGRSSPHRKGRVPDGAFGVHAPVRGGFEVPFRLGEEASGYVWGVVLRAPLGSSAELVLEGPDGEVGRVRAEGPRPARLTNLGLVPGDYVISVASDRQEADGHAEVRLERLGRTYDGVEVEPNDRPDEATLFRLGDELRGVADGTDHLRVNVGADEAGSVWDLRLEAAVEVRLRVIGPDGELLQERRGVSGTSPGLHLDEGTYMIVVSGSGGGEYTLSLLPGRPVEDGFEREPNDLVTGATPMGPEMQARGELRPQDADFFRLDVADEAQRFRLQLVGQGVDELALYDAGGGLQARVTGERRIRLDDVVLMPGTHFLRVAGEEGEYALRALALGPAQLPAPPADLPGRDEALAPAPEAAEEADSPEAAAADPAAAALPSLPPPPPGVLEREPNDDASRAHRLAHGAVHVGRLASAVDEDRYRFHLATSQFMRLELRPAAGESGWRLVLDGTTYRPVLDDGSVVVERWLLAGDHEVRLSGGWLAETPSGYYQLRLLQLGALGAPVDREPNDSPEAASSLPADLRWSGRVGDSGDRDVYRLPPFAEETVMRLRATSGDEVGFDVLIAGRAARLEPGEDGSLTLTLPAGEESYLRVSGQGEYHAELGFSSPPDPAWLVPARDGEGVSVELSLQDTEVAAYWHDGQSVSGTLTLRNSGEHDVEASVTSAANVPGATVELPEAATVPAGEEVELPVTVRLPADMSDEAPVVLQVVAAGAASEAVASAELALRCEASPVAPYPYWNLPDALIGRPNVLLAGLGAVVPDGVEEQNRDRYANDGRTTVSSGGWAGTDHSPTFLLAGGEPVAVIGTVLNPASDAATDRQLRRFRIETSLDGASYETVLEAELSASRVDQAFVFDRPVTARFARLIGIDSHGGDPQGYFGEWKVIAEDPALFSGADLATPELGGHVVWSDPLLGTGDLRNLLAGDGAIGRLDLLRHDAYTFALGFQSGRAALVSEVRLTQPEVDAERLFERVEVAVSTAGAAGPWRPLTAAELGAAGRTTEVELDEPVWARYLRFTFPKTEGGRHYQSPRELTVIEAPVTDAYLSALSEWGTDTAAGPYEYLVGGEDTVAGEGPDAGDTPSEATPVASGAELSGSVAVAEDVDWYRITVPAGENHLEVRLSGDPTVAYAYELTDMAGAAVAFQAAEDGDDVVLSAYVEPGDYLLRLEEPKRTVVFAWDTSGSVSPYQPITYSSLASFAQGVDPSREAVQLLAFNEPAPRWLLPYWSSDTERVQRAITEWDRNADSSNSELALLTATRALAGREGTKAILFMTDAETGGHGLTPDLWAALEAVRPRVFTFEISSGGNVYPQQLMQSWAGVNAGVYQMARGVGDFDAGFARASCLLRRPKRYTVTVTTSTVEPPGPGTLRVVPSPTAGQGAVHVVFDASGSMGQALPSGEPRIAAARRALEDLVDAVLEEGTPFSLRAFGHVAPNSCESSLEVPLGPLDGEAAMAAVRAIEPKLLSQTAIADSLLLAVEDLAGAAGPRTVILVTDGEESCGGDPAAAAAELRAAGDVTIAIVSLALDEAGLAVFEDLAEGIGATYVDVGSFEDLSEAIAAALEPAFEVYAASGELVATGRVGDSVELPMGVYQVRVLTSPVEVFEAVTVPGDGRVEVVVAGER